MAPTELALPTHRVLAFDLEENNSSRLLDLDYLVERRKVARLRMEAYKEKIKFFHDKKVSTRTLYVRD